MKAEPAECSLEVNAKFATLSAAYLSVSEARSTLEAKRPASYRNTEQRAEWSAIDAQYNTARGEFLAFAATIATPDFKKRATSRAIILEVAKGDKDERSYALYRDAVWLCHRPLEAAQWELLVDRLVQREEAELACALAEESGTSQTRERLSPELRRAVWIRGKLGEAGSR